MKKKLIIISVVLLVIISAVFIYGNSMLGKIKTKQIPQDNTSLNINNNVEKDKNIINIVLLGIDGSYERSDSIMVVSIDKTNNKFKVTSLLRDMYIDLPGYGNGILNHAYLKGGPELAIKAVNKNFDLNAKDYVLIQLDGFVKLIDKFGGVNVDVKKEELKYVNIDPKNKINGAGVHKLNGIQAMAYAGIRNIGTDFARTDRQRVVLNEIFKTIKNQGAAKLPGTISTLLPFVETSLSKTDILSLATTVLNFNSGEMEQMKIPVEGYYKFDKVDNLYILNIDLEANKNKLQEFIYGAKEINQIGKE